MSVPYGCNWLQNLLSVSMHLAIATRHLFSPLLFFSDQVRWLIQEGLHPDSIFSTLFFTSFLFSMPGGSWTISSLACKCICASSIQWSMSFWICFSSFLLSSMFPCCLKACPLSWPWWGHCWLELKLLPDFPKWRQEWSLLCLFYFPSPFLSLSLPQI